MGNKKSVGNLEKIFFSLFNVAVHKPGTYSKELLIVGILAARKTQKQGSTQSTNKAIKKIPKLAFQKGHFHYRECDLDNKETYEQNDCECPSKMDSHKLKLELLMNKSKTKKKEQDEEKVNENPKKQ